MLQPLDLTTNGVVKKMEQREFSDYFPNCITEALLADPKWDVTTVKTDLKLTTLKPIHAKAVSKECKHLKSERQASHIERISSGRYNGSCKENTGESKIWTLSLLNRLLSWFSCVEKKHFCVWNKTKLTKFTYLPQIRVNLR